MPQNLNQHIKRVYTIFFNGLEEETKKKENQQQHLGGWRNK